jgi:hypothetical protein
MDVGLTASLACSECRALRAAASASFTMNKSGGVVPSVPNLVFFMAVSKQLLMTALAPAVQHTGTAKVTSTSDLINHTSQSEVGCLPFLLALRL